VPYIGSNLFDSFDAGEALEISNAINPMRLKRDNILTDMGRQDPESSTAELRRGSAFNLLHVAFCALLLTDFCFKGAPKYIFDRRKSKGP
jgi:hypothetical protein